MRFLTGIEVLVSRHRRWLGRRRLGLLGHAAAVTTRGQASAECLRRADGARLAALFGPEHGFFGIETAGARVASSRHPEWGIPVYSLYGTARRPTPAMLRGLDAIVVDLQDLGARCYTYATTLRFLLEQAAALGKDVIVADRPVPLPRVVDGPMLDPAFESFVAGIPAPLSTGMTPGETALWLKRALSLDVNLRVARMAGYARDAARGAGWPPWIPPSPGIRAWEAGQTYLATVFAEALPALDVGRGTALAFQVVSAPWMKSRALREWLEARRLPGVSFHPHPYRADNAAAVRDGLRLAVHDPHAFRPVETGVTILAGVQALYGPARLWRAPGTRPAFFDALCGTDAVRRALQAGEEPGRIAARWRPARRAFETARRACLLY